MEFNGTKQIIDIPGNGSAFLPVVATGPVRYIVAEESTLTAEGAANTLQGWGYQIKNDGSVAGYQTEFAVVPTVEPSAAKLELGDPMAKRSRFGALLGNGPDTPGAGAPPLAATRLFQARSMTPTGTSIVVTQYY